MSARFSPRRRRRGSAAGRATVAALAIVALGCSKTEEPTPATDGAIRGTLAVDIRWSVDAVLTPHGERDLDVALTFGDRDFGFFGPGTKLAAKGTIERFPEASMVLYTAVFEVPARPSSACGDRPVTLALALQRRGDDARTSGGLTAYCGSGKTSGIPARVLRLSGDLPVPK